MSDSEDNATGQVSKSAAEIYDELFPAAIFAEWAPRVCDAAGISPEMRVLDVACGTGVLTLVAAERVGPGGSAVGLDLNPGMLEVARHKAPHIEWRESPAESLPFEDGSFDAVVSQFGLMFFQDKAGAIAEMWRVLRPGGRMAVAVWDSLENVAGYAAVTNLLARLFGDAAANSLRSPYSLGDTTELGSLFRTAGVANASIATLAGKARYPSMRYWMEADIRGWTLADMIDDAQFEELVAAAESELSRFVAKDGRVEFDSPAHIISATR
jgi:ubiquinone/menaquinone biosynthesis C-methylase UbiE